MLGQWTGRPWAGLVSHLPRMAEQPLGQISRRLEVTLSQSVFWPWDSRSSLFPKAPGLVSVQRSAGSPARTCWGRGEPGLSRPHLPTGQPPWPLIPGSPPQPCLPAHPHT